MNITVVCTISNVTYMQDTRKKVKSKKIKSTAWIMNHQETKNHTNNKPRNENKIQHQYQRKLWKETHDPSIQMNDSQQVKCYDEHEYLSVPVQGTNERRFREGSEDIDEKKLNEKSKVRTVWRVIKRKRLRDDLTWVEGLCDLHLRCEMWR